MSGQQRQLDIRFYAARLERSLRKFDDRVVAGGAATVREFVSRLDYTEAAELVRWFEGEPVSGPAAARIRRNIISKWKTSRPRGEGAGS